MKAKIIRLAVVLALLVSLFAVSAPPAMAAAADLAPNYGSISANSGQVGDTITIVGDVTVAGAGLGGKQVWPLKNVPLTVKWYDTSTSSKVVDTIPAVVTTDKTDASYSLAFKIPATVNGAHKVRVTDGINNADLAVFTINTKVKISPTSGPKGTEVTVTATGFSKSTGLTIMDDTDDDGDQATGTLTTKTTLMTDSTGGAVGTYSATSTQTIVAVDGTGVKFGVAGAVSTVKFTMKPKITLDPTEGLVSKKVTISGSNFGLNGVPANTAIVSVSFGGTNMTQAKDSNNVNSNNEADLTPGTFILKGTGNNTLVYGNTDEFTIVFKVPANSAAGAQQIKVTNNAAIAAETIAKANFTVTARALSLSPSSGSVGISVQGTASGFAAGKKGNVQATGLTTISGIDIDSSGNASFSFTVPAAFGPGEKSNTITFADADGNTATKSFKVLKASLTVDPVTGPPGTTVNFTGAGFTGYTTMTVTFTRPGGAAFIISTVPVVVVSDSLGNVSGSLVVPSSGTGTATIAVSDGTTTKSKDFTVKKAVETVGTALQGIEGKFTIVWTFDAATQTWKKYDPAAPSVSDLSKLEKGKGYWIFLTDASTLVFGPGIYDLAAGWNLIGWLGS